MRQQIAARGDGRAGGNGGRNSSNSLDHQTLISVEELPYIPGIRLSCFFQDQVSTPLSADGRRSISSVSSDVSAGSDKRHDVTFDARSCDIMMSRLEEEMAEDVTSSDVSQLLQQINQSDLLFQADGALDDVFSGGDHSDHIAAFGQGLPDHFLHNM
jgi:hypothetical protein